MIPAGLPNCGTVVVNPTGGTVTPNQSTNLRGSAWWVLDYSPLLGLMGDRGEDVTLGHVDGDRPYERKPASVTIPLELVLSGSKNRAGTPYTGILQGIKANYEDLRDNICGPYDSSSPCRSLRWTDEAGGTAAGTVHINLGPIGAHWTLTTAKVAMLVTFPSGRWA